MNQAFLKFFNICNTDTGFQGFSHNIIEDIISMLDENNYKRKPASTLSTSYDPDLETKKNMKPPLFMRNFNQTTDPDSPKYKVGERKI